MPGKETVRRKDKIWEGSIGTHSLDLKYLFFGAGIVVILAAGLLVRGRKKKYH